MIGDTTADVVHALGIIAQGMSALDVVGDAAVSILSTVGKDSDALVLTRVLAYLKTVVAVTQAIGDGLDGAVDPTRITDEISRLRSSIIANDAEASAAVDAKFPVDLPQ